MTCLYLHELAHELPLAGQTIYNLHSTGKLDWLEKRGRQLAVDPARCAAWWAQRGQIKTAERVLEVAARKAQALASAQGAGQ